MITITQAKTLTDLKDILQLQKANLANALTQEELQSQGFVTVEHSLSQLKTLNDIENHVIAKEDGKVIGYLLAMTEKSKEELPILFPMFETFEKIIYYGKKISEYSYLVVGQVCIDKSYRSQGLLQRCYEAYKGFYKGKYDFAITEIATSNQRSLRAHLKLSFEIIHSYWEEKVEWNIVLWDWRINSRILQ